MWRQRSQGYTPVNLQEAGITTLRVLTGDRAAGRPIQCMPVPFSHGVIG